MDGKEIEKLAKGVISGIVSENLPAENSSKKLQGYIKERATKRFLNFIFEQDFKTSAKSVKEQIIKPTVKSLFLEVIMGIFERMVMGDRAGQGRGRSYGSSLVRSVGDNTSYGAYYNLKNQPNQMPEPTRKHRAFQHLKMDSRQNALAVINWIEEKIRVEGACSVAMLYDELEIPESDYTDNDTGWTSVGGYKLYYESGTGMNDPDGWIVSLPNPIVLPRK